MNEEKEIKRLLKQAQSYFGKDEKIYIFKCKKCGKLDSVPSFVLNETVAINKIFRKKSLPKTECPNCNGTMIPIDNFKK